VHLQRCSVLCVSKCTRVLCVSKCTRVRPYRAALGASSTLPSTSHNRTDEDEIRNLFPPNLNNFVLLPKP
jgi:hypothetical protein